MEPPSGGEARLLGQIGTTCVIGVSGTGSIVAEQLARMGLGRVSLVDHDQVEEKNLNRILNATSEHARRGTNKAVMMADAIALHRGEGVSQPLPFFDHWPAGGAARQPSRRPL